MIDSKPPLSCYVRTLNEARMIDQVVRAALRVAREVVVVDSGSTDGTRAIAEAAGARVVEQEWLGGGAQKRTAEDSCAHDWLLDLDADEVVTEELAAEIATLFEKGEPPRAAYKIKLVTQPPHGRAWRRFSLAWRAKLYDRRRVRMPDHRAWDQLELSGVETGKLEGEIVHHSFTGVAHMADKLNKVSSVRAREARLKSFPVVILRVVFAPPVYFIRHYLMRGLWRAGLYGFVVSMLAAQGRWLRDAKMLERHYDRRRSGG